MSAKLLETGIPNLDLILGGGIPEGDVLLVVGPAGAGKTTLAFQAAFSLAARGENVIYVSTLSEPPTRVAAHMRSFSFYDETAIGRHILLESAYPLIKQGLPRVTEALVEAVKEQQARLVIIDGLMALHDLYPETPEIRTFIYELGATLAALGTTVILTSSGVPEEAQYRFPEFTMADGILDLGRESAGMQMVRTVASVKMRGQANLLGRHTLRIDGSGLTVYPRLESVYVPQNVGLSRERVPLGLDELDGMLHGGPLAGSVTLLAGALGTGKTLTGLQFLLAGAARGEKGLFVGLRESPRQLIDKARAFGLDLETPLREGRLAILHRAPVDLPLDQLTWELCGAVERFRPQRLVLDSVADIEAIAGDQRRLRGYMFSLAGLLRDTGATALMTMEVAQVVGPELDFSNTPLAVLAENLILFRYVEFRGELYSILSILKMRDSAYDHSIRQYEITAQGLKVLARIETSEGLLTGIARLPAEARVKRAPGLLRREEA